MSIWLPDADGHRPVFGGVTRLQEDPAWRDNLLFFEYFHGDDGAGLGAMHQTGWTALVVDLLLDPPGAPGRPSPRRHRGPRQASSTSTRSGTTMPAQRDNPVLETIAAIDEL